MLLANIYIAEYLFKYCKDKTLLRAHNENSEDKKEAAEKRKQTPKTWWQSSKKALVLNWVAASQISACPEGPTLES